MHSDQRGRRSDALDEACERRGKHRLGLFDRPSFNLGVTEFGQSDETRVLGKRRIDEGRRSEIDEERRDATVSML
jgi:hypothetical protein